MISLIFPTFNEEGNVGALYQALLKVTDQITGQEFEFIFVDDASTDHTPQFVKDLHDKDRRVKLIRFARNSGSHAAISAGLHHARGECAIVMAADLQDPPEVILDLIYEWKKGSKIVWGVRTQRKGEAPSTQFFSRLYYRTMNNLTAVKTPPSGADVFLADRAVIDAFKQVQEKHTSVFMTLAWLGFPQASVGYVKVARRVGQSKWTLGKKVKLAMDSLLSFSDIPIRYMSVVGGLVACIGFMLALFVFVGFLKGFPVTAWSVIFIAILVLSGVQMMMLGILGEYLWRTFDESRKRPRYIIEYKID